MDANKIAQNLKARFAAPLRDFCRRRIIFWHDEDREFEEMLKELDIPGVKKISLTGKNNFAVKKLLLHDDPTGNYLVYDPFSYARPQDDWMRDIEHFSENFRADYCSLLMSELKITEPALRETVRLYTGFFKSRQRMEKLKKIGRDYKLPPQLHIDVMAVLSGLSGKCSERDVIIAVLSDGLDEEANKALKAFKQYGNINVFREIVKQYTGFVQRDEEPLGQLVQFAQHILLSALAHTMNQDALKGLERFISASHKEYCYSLVAEWRSREDNSKLFEICRFVETKLKLRERFEKLDIKTLLDSDIFPAIHETILNRTFSELADRTPELNKAEVLLSIVENRRTSGWSKRYAEYWNCLCSIAGMQKFYQANAGGFHIVEPEEIWKFYTEQACRMDSFYRNFHFAFGNTLKKRNPVLEDSLKQAADYVERLYRNWFLDKLTECWTNAVSDDLTQKGCVSKIARQCDFYLSYIKRNAGRTRAFVIISDALRYEVAVELCEEINKTRRGSAKLEAMQAVFPSVTRFGMAALLPGREMSVNDRMEVFVDGMPTRSTEEREKILCAADKDSLAVQHKAVLTMKREERRSLVSGKNVVYIYHNAIDAVGDKAATEQKVFDACHEAIQELSTLLGIVVNDMQGTDVFITADHGFLYTYSPLAESDRLSTTVFSGVLFESGRRYAITSPETEADDLLPVQMSKVIAGKPVKGFTPRDDTRIKVAGGGENYVHGGISLQELVVPVIVYKNLRADSKNYVEISNAGLKLLNESRKISNLLFFLDFYQDRPVGEKVQACEYSLYMTDEKGKAITDRKTVIADRTGSDPSDRTFRVQFNLIPQTYDRNSVYKLVIANSTDIPQEINFTIDIAFAGDYGF